MLIITIIIIIMPNNFRKKNFKKFPDKSLTKETTKKLTLINSISKTKSNEEIAKLI